MAMYQPGMQDPEIGSIQQQLTQAGFDPGGVDNIYGTKTTQAVQRFQEQVGITSDGIYGPETAAAMSAFLQNLQTPTQSAAPTQPAQPADLQQTGGINVQPTGILDPSGQPMPDLGQPQPPQQPQTQQQQQPQTQQQQQPQTQQQPQYAPVAVDPPGQSAPMRQTFPEFPQFEAPAEAPYVSPYHEQIRGILNEFATQQPYVSPYATALQKLVEDLVAREFSYDPADDDMFQKASAELTRQVMGVMAQRGILNSTVTADRITQGIADLLPQYKSMAYERFMNEGRWLMEKANLIMNVDEMHYNRFQDDRNTRAQMLNFLLDLDDREFAIYRDQRDWQYNKARDQFNADVARYQSDLESIDRAWQRTEQLGYVDNEAALILGVAPGTASRAAREIKEARQFEVEQSLVAYNRRIQEMGLAHEFAIRLDSIKTQNSLAYQQAIRQMDYEASLPPTGDQFAAYHEFKDQLFRSGASVTEKLRQMESNRNYLVGMMGEELYYTLLQEITGQAARPTERNVTEFANYMEEFKGMAASDVLNRIFGTSNPENIDVSDSNDMIMKLKADMGEVLYNNFVGSLLDQAANPVMENESARNFMEDIQTFRDDDGVWLSKSAIVEILAYDVGTWIERWTFEHYQTVRSWFEHDEKEIAQISETTMNYYGISSPYEPIEPSKMAKFWETIKKAMETAGPYSAPARIK